MQPGFRLPKDLTITLVSGYSAPMRHAIVKRWMELEAQAPAQIKVSFTFAKGMTLRTFLKDNQPWFVAADVCEALDLPRNASNGSLQDHMRRLDDDEYTTMVVPMGNNHRKQYVINESGLYSLILKSRKPEAIAFKKWVTGTVLLSRSVMAADQRQAWREVGEALAYGRALHKSNQAFGQWVKEQGFDDMDATTRSNAMWLAQNFTVLNGVQDDLSHPTHIRAAHREAQADTPPAPDLTLEAPSRLTASIEQVAPQAKRINRLAAMDTEPP